jgi:uncharacterized protein YdaU (DUF1376 family)
MSKKSSAKQPFLPWFVGDFFAATSEWEGEAVSLYAILLAHQWSLGSIPSDPKRACKLVRWDWELFQVHWPQVRVKFTTTSRKNELGLDEDRLINLRLEEHRGKTIELSKKNSASGAKGAMTRWRKDGERHTKDMANANENDGIRHRAAIEKDGERQEKRWPRANGATDSNPSHPIPSHPISETSSPTSTSSEPNSCSGGGDDDENQPPDFQIPEGATPAGALAITLRKNEVSVGSQDPILLAWLSDGFTTDELVDGVGIARISKPHGSIPAKYLDAVVRNRRANPSQGKSQSKQLSRWEQRKRALHDA